MAITLLTSLSKTNPLRSLAPLQVQQNHDGLPQKAGFPQSSLNEIHGAWFDVSNPVVPMEGSLRGDLFQWMLEEEDRADLVLTLGTSLCGMNADRIVETPSQKFIKHGEGMGSVIVNLQRTQMDDRASLRFYAKIDDVMALLALELGLQVQANDVYTPKVPANSRVAGKHHTFLVEYGATGKPVRQRQTVWSLEVGTRVRVTQGPGAGFEGVIASTPQPARPWYVIVLPCQREGSENHGKGHVRYALGEWWVEEAVTGRCARLPIVSLPQN